LYERHNHFVIVLNHVTKVGSAVWSAVAVSSTVTVAVEAAVDGYNSSCRCNALCSPWGERERERERQNWWERGESEWYLKRAGRDIPREGG